MWIQRFDRPLEICRSLSFDIDRLATSGNNPNLGVLDTFLIQKPWRFIIIRLDEVHVVRFLRSNQRNHEIL
jgi:hypothetical protein